MFGNGLCLEGVMYGGFVQWGFCLEVFLSAHRFLYVCNTLPVLMFKHWLMH